MQDQFKKWNQMRINQIAHKALLAMDKEPEPQMMHATQLLQEFLALPIQERGRLRVDNAELIEETAWSMTMLPPDQQAAMLAAGGEGEKVEDKLESLADQAKGLKPNRVAMLLLESLMAEVEEE